VTRVGLSASNNQAKAAPSCAASLLGILKALAAIAVARADPDISVINDGDIS
jgi:hypothetical protein